jgi:3-deoxy-manno-octulosonate cytidylyltransferase (CMP-KDO synthetase)
MRVLAVIPARMASSRFPGKPLASILGLPMVEHVRRRVSLCPLIHDVVVATCDPEILEAVTACGGKAVMTASTHERGTDRIAEAARSIPCDIVLNVQGDEPLVRPEMFEPLLAPLLNEPGVLCTNLVTEIVAEEEFESTDVVKTVFDTQGNVIYFSREPIPSRSKAGRMAFKKYKQLGIIAFRSDVLQRFATLPPTPLEKIESVDMMRLIEHGYPIRIVETRFQSIGVDTPADLAQAIETMKKDPLFPSYSGK